MEIGKVRKEQIGQMAGLYRKLFSDRKERWKKEVSEGYLEMMMDRASKYCLVMENNRKSWVGVVFCKVEPYLDSEILIIEVLMVKEKWQGKGVAKELLKAVIKRAGDDGVKHLWLHADSKKKFPLEWYKKMGFSVSSWVPMGGRVEEVGRKLD